MKPPRRAGERTIDSLAAIASRITPRALTPAIERLRHDALTVYRGFAGEHAPSFRSNTDDPPSDPPLANVNPLDGWLPARVQSGLETAARDLGTIAKSLTGQRPPPLVPRRVRRATTSSDASEQLLAPRKVRIDEITRETPDAVTLHLADVAGASIEFVPGQFLTLFVTLEGERLRRAYSICSDSLDPSRVAVTCKRVAGGRVSNHLNDHATVGDVLEVLGPSGNFGFAPDASHRAHYVLIAGGSGITPMMAILRGVLAREPESFVSLVYGNRTRDDVIFATQLNDFAGRFPLQFALRLVLANPPDHWAGGVGLLDGPTLAAQLDQLPPRQPVATYFVCGPDAMMTAARALLRSRGVDESSIHEERFSSPGALTVPTAVPATAQPVTIKRAWRTRTTVAAPGQTLLEAGLSAGMDMPFSCAMGGCAACKVKLIEGTVAMEEPNCLSDKERAAGYVLACVSRPTSPCRVEVMT